MMHLILLGNHHLSKFSHEYVMHKSKKQETLQGTEQIDLDFLQKVELRVRKL